MEAETDPPSGHALPIEFTGSGSEYFRIWVVNLLLTVLTLGIYFPWAKVRRLRYFFGNTRVGEHALDFHGQPLRMLRGYVLVAVLVGLYSVAGKVSPLAGLLALLILAGLWPALFRASMQFRMANTSWRGLRFRFTGSMAGAYRTLLPLFVPGLLLVATGLLAGEQMNATGKGGLPPHLAIGVGLVTLAFPLVAPLLWWMLKKYQHDHYALGSLQTALRAGPGAFYWVMLKTAGVGLLAGFCGALLAGVVGGGSAFALFGGRLREMDPALVATTVAAIAFALYAALVMVVWPFATSRMQNLVWTRTESADLRFVSALRFWPLFGLTLRNWLLILVTLGLYWPFAAVAMARARLQAVTVYTRESPDAFASSAQVRHDDAAGDAAGDLFGIDIGL